ncbi:MAG: hypothetical protein J7L90_02090, partial [Dehalococcoidia bacterium]|nr:hypothetical protein [Dehalococcoidia bacterium]
LFSSTVSSWVQAVVILVLVAVVFVLLLALVLKVTGTLLAKVAAVIGCLVVMVIPGMMSVDGQQDIMGRGAPSPLPPSGYAQFSQGEMPQRIESIVDFIIEQGDAGSIFTIGMLNAREAAPFITRDVPAVAIGGFGGGDDIFTVESFKAMVGEGKLCYFLLPGRNERVSAGNQGTIVAYIRGEWQDVSLAAGLPRGTLYRYPAPEEIARHYTRVRR